MTVIFHDPTNGSEISSPNVNWLRNLVLNGDSDFWCCGSGQAWLEHPSKSQLLLAFSPEHGFFLEYVDSERVRWIPVSAGGDDKEVPIWICGDPIVVSSRFFVSPDATWAAVEEFCTTGTRSNHLTWHQKAALRWSFAHWDHPEAKLS